MPREDQTFIQFRIDMPIHPTILPLRDKACALWLRSVFEAARAGDAWIPRSTRVRLGGSKRDAANLERAGLWVAGTDGHWVASNDLWRIVRDYRSPVPAWMREAVLERDGRRCQTCGATTGLQMDHIFPWSLGGQTTLENLQALCGPCNRRKGAKIDGLAENR